MARSVFIKNTEMGTARHLLPLLEILANPVIRLWCMTDFQITGYPWIIQPLQIGVSNIGNTQRSQQETL